MRSGDFHVETGQLHSLSQEWAMLSDEVNTTSQPPKDTDLGLARSQTWSYNTMQTRTDQWSDGATKETSRVSESLDQVADGYDWIDAENESQASGFFAGGGTHRQEMI